MIKFKTIFFTVIAAVLLTLNSGILSAQNSAATAKQSETFKKAVKYFFQKKFDMAELLLQQELKENPENQLAYSYLGDIFFERKQYDTAITLYKKAIDLNPDSAEDNFRIGQAYYYKNLPNVAINHFFAAYNKNSQFKYAYYHVGLTYLMLLRDKKGTIENWETYLKIAPEDPQYEKIKRVIELLKDPNFIIPPVGSDISIEEALHLGGEVLTTTERTNDDKGAGHEDKKTVKKVEDIYRDDDDL
ncbi:MAG: tetratricopeptide repeat protein [Spirochaetes bacterium]|nr:tetratricopeptide repeat protein [Spirochaetota bacterium]